MGIAEAFVNAIKSLVGVGKSALAGEFGTILSDLASFALATPVPIDGSTAVYAFSEPPSDTVWAALFPIYQEVQYFVIALFGLALGLTFTTGAIRSSAKTRKQIRRLALYFPLAYWWWWIGGWFLQFNQVLTKSLIGGSYLTGLDGLFAVGLGSILIVAVLYVFGIGAALAVGVVYVARWFVIHVYMVVMPLLFCLRAFPFEPIQGFAGSLITKFYPLVLTTVPVAILFRISAEVLDASAEIGGGSYITPIFAIMTLMLAVILPKLTFQFSGQIQRSVRSASTVARGAASQAASTASGSGSAQQTLDGNAADPAAMGDSGSRGSSTTSASSQSGRDSTRHEAELDFKRRGRRRRQRERGAKGVKAAATAAKKTASGTKKGALGALGGAAKAHEKGKQSDMPTATATAGSAAWQSGEAATSKGKDVATSVSDSVRSGWENQVKRRVQNAREAGQSTVEQARQEARESTGFDAESEPTDGSVDDPEAEVNTAPGDPAMDANQSTSTESFEETEDDTPAADADSPDLTTGSVSQDTTYDRNANDTTVGGFASTASTSATTVDTSEAAPTSATTVDAAENDPQSISAESMVETAPDGTSVVDEQQAEQVASTIAADTDTDLSTLSFAEQDDPIYDELGIEDTPDTNQEYTAVQATRHKLREQADNNGDVPYSGRNDPGGTNEYTFDSSDGDAGSTENVDGGGGLTETERAVKDHLETTGKSPDEVSHASLAGDMMNNDQIDDPDEVGDALDTLRNPDN